jgi:hypothetical protein
VIRRMLEFLLQRGKGAKIQRADSPLCFFVSLPLCSKKFQHPPLDQYKIQEKTSAKLRVLRVSAVGQEAFCRRIHSIMES